MAIAKPGRVADVRFLAEIPSTPEALHRLVERLQGRHPRLSFGDEAGPCGNGVHLLLRSLGQDCIVVAPSLIPSPPGARVKTNRRDATTLAKLDRAGELTPVWVPDAAHRAMHDQCGRGQLPCVCSPDRASTAGLFLAAWPDPRRRRWCGPGRIGPGSPRTVSTIRPADRAVVAVVGTSRASPIPPGHGLPGLAIGALERRQRVALRHHQRWQRPRPPGLIEGAWTTACRPGSAASCSTESGPIAQFPGNRA